MDTLVMFNLLKAKFKEDDAQKIVEQLTTVKDEDLQKIGETLTRMDSRFDKIDSQFEKMESKFDTMQTRIDTLQTQNFDVLKSVSGIWWKIALIIISQSAVLYGILKLI